MLFGDKLKKYFNNIGLRSPKLSDFAGAAIVAAKKRAREAKNGVFNCSVLTQDQFLESIEQLKTNNLNSVTGKKSRAQALLRITSVHFTYVDIQNDNGNLSFFILDAAGAPEAIELSKAIQKAHPDAKVSYCLQRIQKDGESCFNFSLSQAESLSKIEDLHTQISNLADSGALKQDISSEKNDKDDGEEKKGPYILERKHLPIQAFKQTHRQEIADNELLTRTETEKAQPVNKHGDSLQAHVKRHQIPPKQVAISSQYSMIDSGYIAHKFESYRQLVSKYIDGQYGEISLFEFFKDNYYSRSQDILSVNIGAKENAELTEEELKKQLMLFAVGMNASYFPILEGVFAENPNILNEIGEVAIVCEAMKKAVAYFQPLTFELLVKNGASVEQRDPETGLAPIHIVVKEFVTDKKRPIQFLKENGADILAKDNDGKTILDYLDFKDSDDVELLKFLISIEPRIASEYPHLLTIEPPKIEMYDAPLPNPIIDLIGDERDTPSRHDLIASLDEINDIYQKLEHLEEAYEYIINNQDNTYAKRDTKRSFQSYNQSYSDKQLMDIQALKLAYCDLVEKELNTDDYDRDALLDFTKRSNDPTHPHLLDFNRTCYKFFVKKTTSSRDIIDKLLNRDKDLMEKNSQG